MLHRQLSVVIFLTAVLAGCVSFPRTPDVVRKVAQSGNAFTEKDAVEVNRPLHHIAETFKRKAPECLRKKVATSRTQGGLRRREVRAYTPTVTIGKERVELTLQSLVVEGATEVGGPPPDGWYIVVVDAYPVNKNTTRVELYKYFPGHAAVLKAIKNWATGANMSCPDLTQ